MYLITFLAPEAQTDSIKEAIFATGAGQLGNYAQCAWQTLGEGQFMPLKGSNAFIGDVGVLEKVKEFKVEIICADELLNAAIEALIMAHPYETPAYQVIRLENC